MLSAIKSFFSAFGEFFGFLGDRQLIDAGENNEKLKNVAKALKDVENSKKNSDVVDAMSDDDILSELYRDDKDQS